MGVVFTLLHVRVEMDLVGGTMLPWTRSKATTTELTCQREAQGSAGCDTPKPCGVVHARPSRYPPSCSQPDLEAQGPQRL